MRLRRRVATSVAGAVVLFLLVQGLLVLAMVHEQEDELTDNAVAAEASRLAQRLGHDGPQALLDPQALGLPPRFQAWWLGADGQAWPAPAPTPLARLTPGPHRHSDARGEWHLMVTPLAGGRLVVAYDASQEEEKVHDFGLFMAALATLCAAAALALARRLANHAVAPLERVTALLARWAPDRPDEQAAPPRPLDEEAALLDAFARAQRHLERQLAGQQEHLANLRHELRTPLATLRTDLELLVEAAGAAPPDPARARRLQRALRLVDDLADTLSALPAPGAMGTTPSPTPATGVATAPRLALRACVQDAWDSLGDAPARAGLALHLDLPAERQVHADRHVLITLLRNLLGNALEHAAPARCTVRLAPGGGPPRLWVEDDGPGVPESDLPLLFERYWRGRLADAAPVAGRADERGLGLAIARQLANSQGLQLQAEAVQPHGLRLVLCWQAADVDENSTPA
ncbi:sensor histidine kinase [Ideonella livida]|uniref:histidine kinase n=1 Tax=Ideonella livida TaxID=2707176 RepID=A0A7C9PKU9_9BURK|nr:HAMP domain-containing sensor histidine kinase [Ideonella livida]NDY93850.1 HAMP domain-containing histidine kinase [Ideonella livida]